MSKHRRARSKRPPRTLIAATALGIVGVFGGTALASSGGTLTAPQITLPAGGELDVACDAGTPAGTLNGAALVVTCPSVSPSPSPTVSPSASPTPTETVTAPSPTPTPTPTPSPTATAQGWPDAATTGYAADGLTAADLTNVHTGSYAITAPGTYRLLNVTGEVDIKASNVTVTDSQVGCATYGIRVYNGVSNVTVTNTTVVGTGSMCSAGLMMGNGVNTFRGLNISNSGDGVKDGGAGAQVTFADSYVHDLAAGSTSHNDGLQLSGGETSVTVQHNRIDGRWRGETSAILVKPDFGNIANVTITGNLLSGGCYTLYLLDVPSKGYALAAATVTANTWRAGSALYGYTDITTSAVITSSGNRVDEGSAVPGLN